MTVQQKDVLYGHFAVIEVKGVLYFMHAEVAKSVKTKLEEQLIWTSSENVIGNLLTEASEFVVDFANGKVLKP